jgi:hypothetical protein
VDTPAGPDQGVGRRPGTAAFWSRAACRREQHDERVALVDTTFRHCGSRSIARPVRMNSAPVGDAAGSMPIPIAVTAPQPGSDALSSVPVPEKMQPGRADVARRGVSAPGAAGDAALCGSVRVRASLRRR